MSGTRQVGEPTALEISASTVIALLLLASLVGMVWVIP